jgi:hypothetical protein
MAFLLVDLSEKRDWSLVYRGVEVFLTRRNGALKNRKRIYTLLETIRTMLALSGKVSEDIYGLYVLPVDPRNRHFALQPCLDKEDAEATFSEVIYHSAETADQSHNDQLATGCRVQQYRAARLPFFIPDRHSTMEVHSVILGSECYICGLRLSKGQEPTFNIGYLNTSLDSRADIPLDSTLEMIEVAICETGLAGIRFVFSQNHCSQWIGRNSGEGMAHGMLRIPSNADDYYMIIGLDVRFPTRSHCFSLVLIITRLTKFALLGFSSEMQMMRW